MEWVLRIVSNKKGSNPGGFAYLKEVYGYVKFCHSVHQRRGPLEVTHQPIYEYITSEVARRFGILSPPLQVIPGEKIKIINECNNPFFNKPREYYFFSHYVDHTNNGEVDEIYRVYLELIGICDVFKKGDNYGYLKGTHEIIIIDVGCNFVKAINGIMYYNTPRPPNKKAVKKINRQIRTLDGKKINPMDLIHEIPYFNIRMLDENIKVKSILSREEIEYIQGYYINQFAKKIKKLN